MDFTGGVTLSGVTIFGPVTPPPPPPPPPGKKAIFGFGTDAGFARVSMTNLVSDTGVVATDTTGVGTVRNGLAAAG